MWAPQEDLGQGLAIKRPTTDAELAAFFLETLGLVFPSTPCCKGHSTPFAAICDAFFARSPVTVWKASRAFGGKTFAMGALVFAEAVTLRASATILGGSGEQSERVHEYLKAHWEKPRAPRQALSSDPSGKKTSLIWGNKVTALMASDRAVSGPHPQRLRIDEADLVKLTLLDQALGQPMTKDGIEAHVLLSSAHYFPDGTMTEILKRAVEKNWTVHEWCWRECVEPHGWLAKSEIARQRSVVTKAMWDVQYDLQEPSAEGRAIDTAKVERMFVGEAIEGQKDEFPYREFELPVPGASYATGGDWGRTKDYVEIVTFRDDIFPLRLVAYQRFRKRPAPYIIAQWEHQTSRYTGTAAHDQTGLGGKLMHDLITVEGEESTTEGVDMVGKRRQNLFTDYIVAIEHEEIVSPRVTLLYSQHKYVRNEDLRPSGTGHPPDGFVAGAMAYKASTRSTTELRVMRGTPAPTGVELHIEQGIVKVPATGTEKRSGLRLALDYSAAAEGSNG